MARKNNWNVIIKKTGSAYETFILHTMKRDYIDLHKIANVSLWTLKTSDVKALWATRLCGTYPREMYSRTPYSIHVRQKIINELNKQKWNGNKRRCFTIADALFSNAIYGMYKLSSTCITIITKHAYGKMIHMKMLKSLLWNKMSPMVLMKQKKWSIIRVYMLINYMYWMEINVEFALWNIGTKTLNQR